MAAVPSIVSDVCYNAELVKDGVEGVVLAECNADCLIEAILSLCVSPGLLSKMKESALASSERFYIDRYVNLLVSDLVDARRKARA